MVDALFIGAHPDDVEIIAGGTVAKLVKAGHKVAVADATRGEMSTRGTVEQREQECANATKALGIAHRINMNLPDGRIADDVPLATRRVVEAIRTVRPRMVFVHEPGDHHPDHNALSQATKFAFFQSNVLKYETGQERFKPDRLFYFVGSRNRWPVQPSFIVDISDVFETKINSLKAYGSQFANPGYNGPETYLSSDVAWKMIEMRAGFFGSLVGVQYGEAFVADVPLRIDDPLSLPDIGGR